MDFNQLEAFSAVMQIGSATAAGNALGRSQSAISKAIAELELEIGYDLFDRKGPKLIPKDKAYLLHEEIQKSLIGLKTLKQRAEEIGKGEDLPINIIATPALATTILPLAIKMASRDVQMNNIHIDSTSNEHIAHSIIQHRAILGLTSMPLSQNVNIHWIGESSCVAAMALNHPLAQHNVISQKDLKHFPILTTSNRYRLRQRVDQALKISNMREVNIETNTSYVALMLALQGLGVAIIDPATAYGIPLKNIVIKPLTVNIPFYFGVISPLGKQLMDTTDALDKSIEKASEKILQGCFIKHPASKHAMLQ